MHLRSSWANIVHLESRAAFKASEGDLALPRIETSQKAQRGLHLVGLAA